MDGRSNDGPQTNEGDYYGPNRVNPGPKNYNFCTPNTGNLIIYDVKMTSQLIQVILFDKIQDIMLITSLWVSFIGIYLLLRFLRALGNFAPPLGSYRSYI